MNSFVINGNKKLFGEIQIHGSKNSVLPMLAASVLINGESVIHNCPLLSDVDAALKILMHLGCGIKREGHTVTVDSSNITSSEIPDSLMREMRSSVIFLGAILGRTGKAELSTPGGCEIGLRPIDMHISAMKQLGAEVTEDYGRLCFNISEKLVGAKITLPFPSVGATENIIIASCVAEGVTVITNAAREPEITDLANFLNSCGAKIHSTGESTIIIEGVKKLHSATHTVIPDRIAASTYLIAAAATGGKICIKEIVPSHMGALIPVLKESGCEITVSDRWICLNAPERLKRVKAIRTMPYPGFPTDVQSPLTAMLAVADGTSVMIENIFECRYKYVSELIRFGAKISVEGRMAVIEGVPELMGATVEAPDLRGGFALVVAGLTACGETVITGIEHIDRGYEAPEKILSELGANIKRKENYGAEKKYE